MTQTSVVFCTGANATGKTCVLNGLRDRLQQQGKADDYAFHSSIIRGYSASRGYKTELEVEALPPKPAFEYQHDLYNFFWSKVFDRIEPGKVNVFERSPLCHLAHVLMYGSRIATDRNQIEDLFKELLGNLDKLRSSAPGGLLLFRFPFPTSWYTVSHAIDEYRSVGYAKNFVLDALIEKLQGLSLLPVNVVPAEVSIEERTTFFCDKINSYFKI